MAIALVIYLIFALRKHHQPKINNDPIINYKTIDVVHYGAAGDGKTDDSQVNKYSHPQTF